VIPDLRTDRLPFPSFRASARIPFSIVPGIRSDCEFNRAPARVLVAKELLPVIRSLFSFRTLSVVAAVALTMFVADFASAQEATGGRSLINLTSAFSVAVVVMGAAYGISKLAAAAYESMARQPEVAGNIQTAMIIAAALIEGFTFYALFICSGKTN
jgi:F-type H+-transporting ATPase subunit c